MNFPFSIRRITNINVINSMRINAPSLYTPQSVSLRQAISPTVNSDTPNKMLWGEPTWLLLHTLAHKVDETRFTDIRSELVNAIHSICINLPCPDCAEHAKNYLNRTQFINTVQTKNDLKIALFIFHNEVNKRKGLPIFAYSNLDDKYSKAVTINIIYNFMSHFVKKSKSIHMIANDNYRERISVKIKQWFNQNIHFFAA